MVKKNFGLKEFKRIKGVKMKKLPIGLSDFRELLKNDFYYIDKSNYTRNYKQ